VRCTAAWSFFGYRPPNNLDPVFDTAAAVAWKHFNRLWVPATGLARATLGYDKLTPWDIGSVLGALYSAQILGLIDTVEYRARVQRTLQTLEAVPLFDSVFHRMYNARTGKMANRAGAPTTRGYSYSATDLGRLLLWLHIVAQGDSSLAESAARVVRRIKLERVVEGGYMFGEDISPSGKRRRFQEGRIGYEQYAARGYAAWGQDVANALDIRKHATPVTVLGHELLKDARGFDRLSSEPFVLLGLEVGWTADEEWLSRNVLAVQEQRYRDKGIVTIASEDAVGIAPYYFYYYCVYCSGKTFVVEVVDPGKTSNAPRWVSTKATFGWHALLPSEYTQIAVNRVARARTSEGWSSGVFERAGTPTRTYDINTAAIVLEAAAYRKLGRPLLQRPAATAPER
jgi:hypothetical protein